MNVKSLVAVGGIALVCACSKSGSAADTTAAAQKPTDLTLTPDQQARIHIDTASMSNYTPSVSTTGTVDFNGDHSTQVLSPVSGPVTRLLVQPGAQVSRGTPLATVSSPDFAAAIGGYRKAVAAASNLQRIADQDVQLFKTDALSRREMDQAQTDASAAAADRESALEQIRALGINPNALSGAGGVAASNVPGVIRAPISGTVVQRLISPGQLLQAGNTPAFTIADLSTVWVMANVFEADLAAVHKGETATVTSPVSTTPFQGTVDYVGALVDSATRATSVRIVVKNRSDLLKSGMYVNVTIRGDGTRSGILVPNDAVLRDDENLPFVFVATGEGKATRYARRRITLGQQIGGSYQVQSGLRSGDRVVAEGALFLQFAESL
ncbi:MAG: efflux RND transporter periplasmic adaptor subunit [Gemmatimonadota bacterium]|nr:efflux RND transporter periplasmic adaptor subunit [Gemmatimonadota bacterium]